MVYHLKYYYIKTKIYSRIEYDTCMNFEIKTTLGGAVSRYALRSIGRAWVVNEHFESSLHLSFLKWSSLGFRNTTLFFSLLGAHNLYRLLPLLNLHNVRCPGLGIHPESWLLLMLWSHRFLTFGYSPLMTSSALSEHNRMNPNLFPIDPDFFARCLSVISTWLSYRHLRHVKNWN